MTHPADSRLANNLAPPLGLLTPSGGRLIVSFAAGSSRRESSWVEASCHPRFSSRWLQKTPSRSTNLLSSCPKPDLRDNRIPITK